MIDITDMERPWERLPHEQKRMYEYALKYFLLGPSRTIEKLGGKQPTDRLNDWLKKWQWDARAAAYDLEEARKAAEAWERSYQQAERDRRERKLKQSDQLLAQADLMMGFPLSDIKRVVQKNENGDDVAVQIFKAAKWSKRDVVSLLKAAYELGSQAIRNDGAIYNVVQEHDVYVFRPYKPKKES